MITEKEFCLGTLLHDDKHTTVYHEINVGTKDIDNLNGTVDFDILGNINEKTVLCQHRVQSRDSILMSGGNLSIIFSDEIGLFCSYVPQRVNNDTCGKLNLREFLTVEAVVNNKIKRRTKVWYVTFECVVRVHRDS